MRLGATQQAIRGTCAFGLACLVTGSVPAAKVQDFCGATIVNNLELDQDLTCPGDGLTVGTDNIRINLNGHTITGSGSGAGLVVTGRTGISIQGGTITNFATGVRVNTSTDVVIKDNAFVGNPEGIDFQAGSIGNTVKDNRFQASSIRGIMLRATSRDNQIKDNTFTDNRVGILVFAGDDNIVKANVISGSSLAGIRFNVFANGNLLKENTVMSSAVGIEFIVTPTGSATGNDLRENRIWSNDCGLKGPTAGNTLKENSFRGNITDTCA